MTDTKSKTGERPKFSTLHHISLPCRDVKEAISFYCELLGGELIHEQWGFILVSLGGTYIGISSEGASWTEPENEYPHAQRVMCDALLPTMLDVVPYNLLGHIGPGFNGLRIRREVISEGIEPMKIISARLPARGGMPHGLENCFRN